MATVIREISVDVSQLNRFAAIVAKQYDQKSRFLKVHLLDNGEPILVDSGATVTINAHRADDERKRFAGTVNADGTVTVPLTSWMLALDDTVNCDISIIDGEDVVLSTTLFELEVQEAAYNDDGISEDENYDILVKLINDVQNLQKTNTAKVEQTADGATITITDAKGTTTATVKNGKDGKDGKDATVDATLTVSGKAADAAVVGTKITQLEKEQGSANESIGDLQTKMELAYPDNTGVGDATWGAKQIIDTLCPPLEESGNPVQCYPVAGYPLGCKVSWEPVQEGSGDPSPDNIRAIKGRDSIAVTRCGENLLDTVAGYVNALVKSERCTYTVQDNVITIRATGTDAYLGEVEVNPGNKYNPTLGPIFTVSEDTSLYLLLSNTSVSKNYITFYDSDLVTIGNYRIIQTNSTSFIVPKGAVYASLRIGVGNSVAGESYSTTISVTVGTATPSTYTPYTGQTTTLTLPETVYGGEVDAVTGEGRETWIFRTFNGTESWYAEASVDNSKKRMALFIDNHLAANGVADNNACSNYYKAVSIDDTWNKVNGVSAAGRWLLIYDSNYDSGDMNEWNAYLAELAAAGTPLQVAYKVLTPRAISATGAQSIPAISGVNTILTNADTVTVTGRADPIKRITDLEDAVASMTN